MNSISLEQCKQIQLNLLLELDRICRTNNLHYYIAYGSMLGAVRHKGFIPWDDDIDICMLRKDYEQLLRIIKDGACEWMSIIDDKQNGYYLPFAKAVDNRTITKQECTKLEHGIWVDIFPLDGIPKGKISQKLYLLFAHLLRNIMLFAILDFSSERVKHDTKRYVKRLFAYLCNIIGIDNVFHFILRYCRKYDYEKTGVIGCLGTPYVSREKHSISDVLSTVEYEFEGYRFLGVKDYDKYLTLLYGDYMQLPPEEKRKTHGIIAWWKE